MNFKVFGNFFKKREVKMKFKVLRNVHIKDKTTGRSKFTLKGDTVDLSDMELIDSLVRDFFITPDDNELVPKSGLYKALHQFNESYEGEVIKANAGAQLTLSRDIAVRLMSRGYVIPEDSRRWYPGRPEYRREGEIKKMYDDLNEGTEGQTGFISSWKEGK